MATSSRKSRFTPAISTILSKKQVAKKSVAPVTAKKLSVPATEKPITNPAPTTEMAHQKNVKIKTITPDERYQMIATAAYFCAERREFACGYEMEDWIFCEAQIDATLIA